MTKHHFCAIVCALLLYFTLFSVFTGCAHLTGEPVTIYPCYFNRDVENVNYTVIHAALTEAGWERKRTEQNEEDNYTVHYYTLNDPATGKTKVLSINEHGSAEAAEAHYDQMWENNSIVAGFAISRQFEESYLRISNCSIMALANAHVDLLALLDLGEVQPLEASLDNSYEACKDAKSVDIDAVKAAMEADGYKFYTTVFVSDEEQTASYVIISPNQDRTYAFVRGSSAKSTYNTFKRLQRNFMMDMMVGVHFVGFADGSCVMCYGESFEEIRGYFVP